MLSIGKMSGYFSSKPRSPAKQHGGQGDRSYFNYCKEPQMEWGAAVHLRAGHKVN
jgi:hypothetical protein